MENIKFLIKKLKIDINTVLKEIRISEIYKQISTDERIIVLFNTLKKLQEE